jgi:hypothetical protein
VLGIVGDPEEGCVEIGTFPDAHGGCGEPCGNPFCYDFGASAHWVGDELEDLPVYLLPAATVAEVNALSASAVRYEESGHVSPQALFLVGDRWLVDGSHEDYLASLTALASLRSYCTDNMYHVFDLHRSWFPDDASGAELEDAFVTRVNYGIDMICGYGPRTSRRKWPGDFLDSAGFDWDNRLTMPQSLIVLLPNCRTAAPYPLLPMNPMQLRKGLFAGVDGTTIAFASGHLSGAFDSQHFLWTEVLGDAMADADAGTPWPEIIWDAKLRARSQYPFLKDYLRSVGSLGTMVRHYGTVTDAQNSLDSASLPLSLRAEYGPGERPRLLFQLPQRDHISLTIYDAQGRSVAVLYSGVLERGLHRLTWNGRNALGQRVASGVYFARMVSKDHGRCVRKILVAR